jgi:hypothetical protein
MKLSETQADWSWLLLGGSGSGKTHFGGTLCQAMPTLVVTADPSGLETLRTMGIDTEVVLIDDWVDSWKHYEEIAKAAESYAAVFIDDLGSVQNKIRDKVNRSARGQREESMRANDLTAMTRQQLMRGERRLAIQQWGEMATALDAFLAEVLKLPFRVTVMTVTEELRQHPRTGEDHLFPSLQGSIRNDLTAKFSLVCNTFVHQEKDGTVHWCMTSRPHSKIPTKDRYGIPRTWLDPSATKLVGHIKGEEEPETNLESRIGTGLGG